MANIDSKSSEFYAKHVKNIWISTYNLDAFERILRVCSGVQNLLLFPIRSGFTANAVSNDFCTGLSVHTFLGGRESW